MGIILDKLQALESAKDALDSHIWHIFHRYLDQELINFSHPTTWEIEGDDIHFTGTDGCRGCYDRMGLRIPIKFFDDPETEFPKLAEQRAKENQEKVQAALKQQEAIERREFERLKNKFANVSFS
jgi:hypothetical protein